MINSAFSLAGKSALITGANTGIGQGLAIGLAEAGANIVAVGRSPADETATIVRKLGRRWMLVEADLSRPVNFELLIEQAGSLSGQVDILANNAGIIRRADALEFSEQDWDSVMTVNLKTSFFLSQAFARAVIGRSGTGKIINIASMLSFQGGVRVASYTASKSGLAGLTRLLANEWALRGINVNAIAPGYIDTANTKALREDSDRNRDILARIPAGRWGQPNDLAGAAVFLASSASDYVHGAILPVDGGWMAR
jgi:2-dehydro-3-deoxy-D-gluconate 5-dehydrogenase